jgi:dTDP-4-dehydrorhamnose reductase
LKKVLVIGSTGQLGGALLRLRGKTQYEVIGLCRADLDVTDSEKLVKYIDEHMPVAVINTTAYHVLANCETHPEKAFTTNTLAVAKLAALCADRGTYFVTYSTDYVFDGKKGWSYSEADTANPLQMYGLSKYAGELAVRNVGGEKCIVIRTAGVFGGDGSRSRGGNFITNILKQAKGRDVIEVSNEHTISVTWADDLAFATLMLLKNGCKGIYHLVNEGVVSWAEVARLAVLYAKMDTVVKEVQRHGHGDSFQRPLYSALKNQRAHELGIFLPSWKDSLELYIKELQDR